jgi:predicted outer membrane repeat protein
MATIFCDPGLASGSNNGTSWENAYQTFMGGINGAGASDEVWVKARTASTTATYGEAFDHVILGVYGGFANDLTGTSGSKAGRDLVNNRTTLDGGNLRMGLRVTVDYVIDGFIIQNCYNSPGGIYAYGAAVDLAIYNTKFISNSSGYMGGGILMESGNSLLIEDCLFDSNSADAYGGAISAQGTTTTIRRTSFLTNSAGTESSGIRKSNAGTLTMEDCTFKDGVVVNGGWGCGNAIKCVGGTNIITRCKILDNLPGPSAGTFGGGFNLDGGTARLTNCIIAGNAAGYGGGVMSYGGAITITNCIIADNTATESGPAVENWDTMTIVNSIIWGNGASPISGSPTITYSDVQGGYTGTGNVDDDPHFVTTGDDPYNFGTTTSNAIDAGNAGATYYPTTDYLGQARVDYSTVTNTGAGTPAYSDMGAYEMQEAAPPAATTAPLLLLFN